MQTHKCNRFDGDHPPGIECLDDDQAIYLLQGMEADTLLEVGRVSDRLYTLVADKRVWRQLLKKIDAFTSEKVKELALYMEKAKSQEMRQEVLREAGKRLKEQARPGNKMTFVLTVPGWGATHTLEMDVGLCSLVKVFCLESEI